MVHARLARGDTGSVTERRFRAEKKLEDQTLDLRELDFLYQDGDGFIFMDPTTYNEVPLSSPLLGSFARFLKEGMRLTADCVGEQPAAVRAPKWMGVKAISLPLFHPGWCAGAGERADGWSVERLKEKKG